MILPATRTVRPSFYDLFRYSLVLLIFFSLAGCLIVEDQLVIKPDGSGSVTLQTSIASEFKNLIAMRDMTRMESENMNFLSYPPLTQAEAALLFPGDGFDIEFEAVKDDTGQETSIVKVTFTDINQLLKSPYARARSLSIEKRDGQLIVESKTGLDSMLALEDLPEEMFSQIPIPVDQEQLAKAMGKLKLRYSVILPNAVEAGDAHVQADTAAWEIDRAAMTDKATVDKALRNVMRATCSADKITFDPATPPRLNLVPYDQLESGPRGEDVKQINAQEIIKQVRVVPLRLSVNRSFDLSGRGHSMENNTQFEAVVILPGKYAPKTWGEPSLVEAVDDTGLSLLQNDEDSGFRRSYMPQFNTNFSESKAADAATHRIQLNMKNPDPEAKAIRKLDATLDAAYSGRLYVIKPDQKLAIPEASTLSVNLESQSRSVTPLAHPLLDELNAKAIVNGIEHESGMVAISLQWTSHSSTLEEVQLFDNNIPIHSYAMQYESGEGSSHLQIMIPGKPKGPLTMAFLVNGMGPKVTLPIKLNDLSLAPNEPPASDDNTAAGE